MIELMSDPQHRADMKKRLARIEGQLRGIQKLMDESVECEKVLQQMTAARKALDRAFFAMMACVIEHNVLHAEPSSPAQVDVMAEVRGLLAKYS